jgi:hypothetical protein
MSQVTPVSEWKRDSQPNPLTLPSGKTCLARPAGIEAFITAKIIPNSLMEIVTKAVQSGKDQKADELDTATMMSDLAKDPEKFQDIFGMADNVTMYCVMEPQVHPIPPPDEDGLPILRDPNKLYVDEIDLEDKLFIMNFGMGGSRDLEAFRSATALDLGSLPPGDIVQLPPQRPSGD